MSVPVSGSLQATQSYFHARETEEVVEADGRNGDRSLLRCRKLKNTHRSGILEPKHSIPLAKLCQVT